MRSARSVWLSVAWLAVVALAFGLAPMLTESSPVIPVGEPLLRPAAFAPMGTDDLGRDEWSRWLYGGRLSLLASLSAAGLAVILGTGAALAAQGIGGAADATVVGGSSAAMAIPGLLLALLFVAVLGPGIDTLILSVGIGLAPGFARLARQALVRVRAEAFVGAAEAMGASGMETARRHLLPNALPHLLSLATTHYAWAFSAMTTLTFLGLGGDVSRPEWGSMLNAARLHLSDSAWLALFPAAGIAATILSVHTLGSWAARRATGHG